MKFIRGIREVLTLEGARKKGGRGIVESDLGFLSHAEMLVDSKGDLVWIGKKESLPKAYHSRISEEVNLRGNSVLPGWVECHTHSVFAGDRSHEFELRNQGVTYQEIAAQGGGILSTVRKTREISEAELLKLSQARVNQFVRQGVTTLEVKSGYGLSPEAELKMLSVMQKLKGPKIFRTFLGAHAKPPEFKTSEEYLKSLESVLKLVADKKLAERVDIFVEEGYFKGDSVRRYLEVAKGLGFEIVIHADQLTRSGGTKLAVEMGAKSADHVLKLDDEGILHLAKSEVVAVLLPIADLYLKCPYPPARKLIEAGACVAIATDFNPGTAPSQSVNLAGVLARLEMKMSLPEVISAYTVGAAYALNWQNNVGSLLPKFSADFSVWESDWDQLFYAIGDQRPLNVFKSGKEIYRSASRSLKNS